MTEVPKPPSLAAEIYAGLRLSPRRVRFMVAFTAVVVAVSVAYSITRPRSYESTAVVDVAAFAVSGTAAFELQSLTDEFLTALDAPSTIRETADDLEMATGTIDAGLVVRRDENATRVTVAFRDADPGLAGEVATTASRNALRSIADQRLASAARDVAAAQARLDAADAALDAFESERGQRGIPAEYARLTGLVDQLTAQLATSPSESVQAALDAAEQRRAELEVDIRAAESLEAERGGAQAQLLDANTRRSQAGSQREAADDPSVVQPGFNTRTSRLPGAVTGLASGLVIGVVASYALSWFLLRRARARPSGR